MGVFFEMAHTHPVIPDQGVYFSSTSAHASSTLTVFILQNQRPGDSLTPRTNHRPSPLY